jgi:hypothetical protein
LILKKLTRESLDRQQTDRSTSDSRNNPFIKHQRLYLGKKTSTPFIMRRLFRSSPPRRPGLRPPIVSICSTPACRVLGVSRPRVLGPSPSTPASIMIAALLALAPYSPAVESTMMFLTSSITSPTPKIHRLDQAAQADKAPPRISRSQVL